MNRVIETKRSFLDVGVIGTINNSLIDACVSDIESSLHHHLPITVFGKPGIQRRDIGFFSDESIGYRYSNQMVKSQRMTKNLKKLMKLVNSQFECDFNGILVNRYVGGDDHLGAHSDDESALGRNGVVGISVGAVRKFRVRDKTTKKIVVDIPTDSYGVVHMGGDFQKEFTHEIPKEKKVEGTRISFTFRKHLV